LKVFGSRNERWELEEDNRNARSWMASASRDVRDMKDEGGMKSSADVKEAKSVMVLRSRGAENALAESPPGAAALLQFPCQTLATNVISMLTLFL
jgi:hypothetical protein